MDRPVQYRETARQILLLYGAEPEFREILKTYGDAVFPVIQYFRENDVWTVRAIDATGKAVARSGKPLNLATRTRLVAPRLLAEGQMFRKLGAYGAAVATIYVIARHPSLLNSVFAELAELVGVSPWIVQAAGWSVILAFLCYVFSWLLIPIAKFALVLLKRFERSAKPV